MEESLVVGQHQPLIQVQARELDTFDFHCIRSTVAGGQVLLRWQNASAARDKTSKPQIHAWVLDSILSRHDPAASVGEMIQLGDDAEPTQMQWKAANSVYAGWKKLLTAKSTSIGIEALTDWRKQWNQTHGDRTIVQPWPSDPLSQLGEVPAHLFLLPATSPAAFAALTGTGAIGCVVGWLPDTPAAWRERAYDPPIPAVISADTGVPPAIADKLDGLYHGEKIDLKKVQDLSAHLSAILKEKKPAPKVVLHLTGKGTRLVNSMRFQGIPHLVLYFESAKDPKDALILNPTGGQRSPLIEMDGGHLEIIGARIELSSNTIIPSMIQVRGGDLTLTRCWLQGPLNNVAEGFKSVISFRNTTAPPATLWLRNNIILSGKLLMQLEDQVQVKARNNLFLGLHDAIHYEGKEPTGPLKYQFDHNTFAVRHTTFGLRTGAEFLPAAPMLLHANSNAFLHPFPDDAEKATLLRGAESLAARGQWVWQGRYNVYDKRLHAYFAPAGKLAGTRQSLKDWQTAWGAAGEHGSLLLEPTPTSTTITLDGPMPAAISRQLASLALPKTLRGDPGQAPPGADMKLLGLVKK